jgi:hypothetical protein
VYVVRGNDEEICISTEKAILAIMRRQAESDRVKRKTCKYGVLIWTKYVHGESLKNQRYLVEHTAIIHTSINLD